jgi:hypothetical protein
MDEKEEKIMTGRKMKQLLALVVVLVACIAFYA